MAKIKKTLEQKLRERYPPLPEPTSEAERLADAANTCAFIVEGGQLCGKRRYIDRDWQHDQPDRFCVTHMKLVAPKRFRERIVPPHGYRRFGC